MTPESRYEEVPARRLKVLFLVDTLETGGTERSLIELAAQLDDMDAEICHVYRGNALKADAEAAGVRVLSLDIPGKYSLFMAVRALCRVLRDEKPHILHTALVRSDLVGRIAGRLEGVPVVGSFVNETYGDARTSAMSTATRLKLQVIQLADRFTARWVVNFVAVSERVAVTEGRALGVESSRITHIPRGRRLSGFTASEVEQYRAELRSELGITTNSVIAIHVGRLVRRKGHGDVLEAFRLLVDRLPELHVVFVGEGPMHSELVRRIDEMNLKGRAHLLGNRSDVSRLLAASDMFVFPSRFEGHPGALVEALLAGLPTVVSDIPVHREFLDDRKTALFVPAGDPDRLADAISLLCTERASAREIGMRARVMAEERFDIRRIARRYEDLYQRIAATSRDGRRAA